MKITRSQILFICFILWGIIILASSLRQITWQRSELLAFANRIAAKNTIVYAVRAPIIDCNGVPVAYSEWQFYILFNRQTSKRAKIFCRQTAIPFEPVTINKKFCLEIPQNKLQHAIINAKKNKLQIRKREIRKTVMLPPQVKHKIGITLFRHGLYGLEKKYNSHLQGQPGFYQIMLGPTGASELSNMKIFLPLRPGKPLKLKQSLFELQCGSMPQPEDEK